MISCGTSSIWIDNEGKGLLFSQENEPPCYNAYENEISWKLKNARQGIEYQLQYDSTGLGTCDQPWGHWLDYQVSFQFDIVETQLKGKFHAPLSRQSFNLDDS